MEQERPLSGERRILDRHLYVPHYLTLIANASAAGASRLYLARFGFGINEARVLAVLGHMPGSTAAELGRFMAMHKSILSRSLNLLLARGLIAPDGRGRSRRFRLTEAGYELHDVVVTVSLERERLLLEGIAEEERSLLLSLLTRMLSNTEKMNAFELPEPPGAERAMPSGHAAPQVRTDHAQATCLRASCGTDARR